MPPAFTPPTTTLMCCCCLPSLHAACVPLSVRLPARQCPDCSYATQPHLAVPRAVLRWRPPVPAWHGCSWGLSQH
jgi:hypothetical protein